MITIQRAYEKAKKEIEKAGGTIADSVFDDGEYYVFSYAEETEDEPVGVNKKTGNVIVYFPPEHPETGKELVKGRDF